MENKRDSRAKTLYMLCLYPLAFGPGHYLKGNREEGNNLKEFTHYLEFKCPVLILISSLLFIQSH